MERLFRHIKPILAIMVVLFTFTYFFIVLISGVDADPQIIIALVAVQQIPLSYYFGNSQGSAKKDEIIQDNIKNK